MTMLFDQSLFVRASIQGVLREALIAACLTALMILLFLGNWKSTLIIAISIPLSILVSISCSARWVKRSISYIGWFGSGGWHSGGRRHVEIENINRNLAMGKETVQAFSTAHNRSPCRPCFHAMHLHRVHSNVFLSGVARFLFVPWPRLFPLPCSRRICGREQLCRRSPCICSPPKMSTTRTNTRRKAGLFRRYQQRFEHHFEDSAKAIVTPSVRAEQFHLICACFLGFCVLSAD